MKTPLSIAGRLFPYTHAELEREHASLLRELPLAGSRFWYRRARRSLLNARRIAERCPSLIAQPTDEEQRLLYAWFVFDALRQRGYAREERESEARGRALDRELGLEPGRAR